MLWLVAFPHKPAAHRSITVLCTNFFPNGFCKNLITNLCSREPLQELSCDKIPEKPPEAIYESFPLGNAEKLCAVWCEVPGERYDIY